MSFKSVLIEFVDMIMDSLEEFVDTAAMPKGKKLNHVLYVLFGFLAFSLITLFMKVPVFVTWQEALAAIIMMTFICCINKVTKTQVEGLLNKIKNKKRR